MYCAWLTHIFVFVHHLEAQGLMTLGLLQVKPNANFKSSANEIKLKNLM
jgi:hypothetical protein